MNTQPNTIIETEYAKMAALAACRGEYQKRIILGNQCWSGADLQGKAKRFSDLYKRSRINLLSRINDIPNIEASVLTGRHGKLILQIREASFE